MKVVIVEVAATVLVVAAEAAVIIKVTVHLERCFQFVAPLICADNL